MPKHSTKDDFPVSRVRQYLEPGPIVLVTSKWEGKTNIMTLGWHTVMEFTPSLVGCVISAGNLPSLVGSHRYFVRFVDLKLLEQEGPFRLLALWLPEARQEMGNYSIAIVRLSDGRYLLLTTKRELTRLNLASAEEIQDQDCHSST